MLKFTRHQLTNGLKVFLIPDDSTPFVVVNITYNVGSRDEEPEHTGFAHLFEHLMFGGSKHAPSFDQPLEYAGASNNAFTNTDVTNYYDIIPRQNLETALWLESDRMSFLNIDQKSLDVQKKVVIEEFKERYLNKPYGQAWHHIRELSYDIHPYRWPTIGRSIDQIEQATLLEVEKFYTNYYQPNNAILSLAGNVNEDDIELVEKWFGDLPSQTVDRTYRFPELPQMKAHRIEVLEDVPVDMIYIAFHMPGKNQKGYYECDLLSDILSNGNSSRLYQQLVKEKKVFNQISAFILGSFDPGLFVITGKVAEGISNGAAEHAIWECIDDLFENPPSEHELQKVQNKVEATILYKLMDPMTQAIQVSFFELIGNAEEVNKEHQYYQDVTIDSLLSWGRQIFSTENSNTVWYKSKQHHEA